MKSLTDIVQRSIGARTIIVGLAVLVVLLTTTPATAHGWQETVQNGDYELGIDSSPGEPVADVPTEFTGRITKTTTTEESDGHHTGIVNRTVAVTVTGPNGYRDRFETTIPGDDPYFTFSYTFPARGTYEVGMETTIDNETVDFQFTRNVSSSAETGTEQPTATNGDATGIDGSTVVLGVLSGAAALFSLCAFVTAVKAYRGTD